LASRYLELALQQHDSTRTQFAYSAAAADAFFEQNADKRKGWKMPAWLVQAEMGRDAEGWVARAVKWGWIEEAVEWTAEMLRRVSLVRVRMAGVWLICRRRRPSSCRAAGGMWLMCHTI
jgi:nuclear pore complex protein Nup160